MDSRGKKRVGGRIDRPVSHFAAGGILAKVVVALPVSRRSVRSRRESAAAVRTHVVQDRINTCGTERTLIATDACLK